VGKEGKTALKPLTLPNLWRAILGGQKVLYAQKQGKSPNGNHFQAYTRDAQA